MYIRPNTILTGVFIVACNQKQLNRKLAAIKFLETDEVI